MILWSVIAAVMVKVGMEPQANIIIVKIRLVKMVRMLEMVDCAGVIDEG